MALLSREQIQPRLEAILPPAVVSDSNLRGPLAAAAVFVALYCEAIDGKNQIRPSTVLWMCDKAARRTGRGSRGDWYQAAMRGHDAVRELVSAWGFDHQPWYSDNTREPLRDEIFRNWRNLGAVLRDPSVKTTSSLPSWSLAPDFAALFEPGLKGRALERAIQKWQDNQFSPVGRARVAIAEQMATAAHAIKVKIPGGHQRELSPGESSLILKGVIEELAPGALGKPAVLTISESAKKVDLIDEALLKRLGLKIKADRLLPDAILFDADAGTFWFVEAVATDGEIHEERRGELLQWAADQGIAPDDCRFVSAFLSRNAPAFRKRVNTIAWGTLAWFLDEPDKAFRLDELSGS